MYLKEETSSNLSEKTPIKLPNKAQSTLEVFKNSQEIQARNNFIILSTINSRILLIFLKILVLKLILINNILTSEAKEKNVVKVLKNNLVSFYKN